MEDVGLNEINHSTLILLQHFGSVMTLREITPLKLMCH